MQVLAAAELALLDGDVSGIEHVDCLYIQDPSFYSWCVSAISPVMS